MSGFIQDGPTLGNQYAQDELLRAYLGRVLPTGVLADIEPDLQRFGQRVVGDVASMAEDAESNQPQLVQFDAWGHRVDRIVTSAGWRGLDRVSAEEGLVAIGYGREQGRYSRIYQFAKLYLFNNSSALYTCPLAMTDGAARCIEVYGDDALRAGPFSRLTSRDPTRFWTSGQWMTERTGGSDVGRTETVARRQADGSFRLFGTKWFTSATTSQMSLTLARIERADGSVPAGSRGLSLFFVETHRDDGSLNDIVVHRLKDKLGTRALPTAELTLDGTPAQLIGQSGRGVRQIASLINVTRAYNAICSIAPMRRGLALMRDYAGRREVFGRALSEQPLHLATLAELTVDFHAMFQLAFRVADLTGASECGEASDEEVAELRLLTPLTKLITAKRCVAFASETLEAFGGAGYVEDTGLPRLLRDAQVLPIWEGTTNVLSLDVLRAMDKESAFEPFVGAIRRRIEPLLANPRLRCEADKVDEAVRRIVAYLPRAIEQGPDYLQAGARGLAYSLARTYAASLLLEQARWALERGGDLAPVAIARRWCQSLAPLSDPTDEVRREDRHLALGLELSARGG